MLCYFSLELLFKLQFRGVKTIFIYYIHYIIIYSHIHLYILVNIFTIFIFIIPLTNNNKLSDLKIHTFIILFCRSQGQHSSHWAKIKMWATSRGKFISCFFQPLNLPVFCGLCFFLPLRNQQHGIWQCICCHISASDSPLLPLLRIFVMTLEPPR